MAVTKGNGLPSRVQPTDHRFVSTPRSAPLRVAHPPPVILSNGIRLSYRVGSRLLEDVCPGAPINFQTRGHLAAERTFSHGKSTSV